MLTASLLTHTFSTPVKAQEAAVSRVSAEIVNPEEIEERTDSKIKIRSSKNQSILIFFQSDEGNFSKRVRVDSEGNLDIDPELKSKRNLKLVIIY
jgi:hypothetical protein